MEVENLRFVLARGWVSSLGWSIKHGSVKQSFRVCRIAASLLSDKHERCRSGGGTVCPNIRRDVD